MFRLPAFHASRRKRLVKQPKLHFLDTGLACWLLGIRAPQQLRSHPLRGPLFETWVVSEVVKHRANRGEPAGLSSRVRDHLADGDRPCGVVVVYGGDELQQRSEGRLLPWSRLHQETWHRGRGASARAAPADPLDQPAIAAEKDARPGSKESWIQASRDGPGD